MDASRPPLSLCGPRPPQPGHPPEGNKSGGGCHRQDSHGETAAVQGLSGAELDRRLEEVLNDRNLTAEKKMVVRTLPEASKRRLLANHYKDRRRTDQPSDFIRCLQLKELGAERLGDCLLSLKVALANNPVSWVQEFCREGLGLLLEALEKARNLRDSRRHEQIQYECLRCILTIMNTKVGLSEVLGQKDALAVLARSLEPSRPLVMSKALLVLTLACLVDPDGHWKTLEALSVHGDFNGRDRFAPIIDGLRVSGNVSLRVSSMQLINALVLSPDEMDFKIHLRNEIMSAGLIDLLEELKRDPSEELAAQLSVFNDQRQQSFSME